MNFFAKTKAYADLAIKIQLEYRFNLFADVALQPFLVAAVEMTVWSTIFISAGSQNLGGFTKESYLAYALWAAFIARVNSSWMYEFKMVEEVDSGSVNSILVRPISFYHFYLGQFLGYKFFTGMLSLVVPFVATLYFDLPIHFERLPGVCLLSAFYLILLHTMSFLVASLAFFFNRVHSLTVAKNVILWLLSGELFPLDILPEPAKSIAIHLPFASSGFLPVGYLIGRVDTPTFLSGFVSVACGLVVFGLLSYTTWKKGSFQYTGQGA